MAPNEVRLVEMTETEFDLWSVKSIQNYAADKARSDDLLLQETEEIAKKEFKGHLPQGLGTKDNFLFSLKDDQGLHLGYLWFCIRSMGNIREAYLCDLLIEELHQGKGHGKKTMLLLEEEVKKHGLKEIRLHVFGFNARAIALYESLGYRVTDLVMVKAL